MGTVIRKLGDGAKSESWHVRNERGETFGPVDLATLKLWACDGRLAPTNEISTDGIEWKIVTSLRSLEMDWVSEVTAGTFYGPIHRCAMEELVKDGSLTAQSALFFRRGLAEAAVPPAGVAQQTERERSLADEMEQLRKRVASADERLCQARDQATMLQTQVEQAREQLACQEEQSKKQVTASIALTEQAQRQTEEVKALLRVAEQQLAAQTEQMQRQAAVDAEQLRLAQQQATAYAAQVEQVQQQVAGAEERMRAAVEQTSEQAQQTRVAQQQATAYAAQAEQAQQKIAEAEARLRAATELASKQAQQATEGVAQLQQQVARAEARLRVATEQVSEQARQAHVSQQHWVTQTERQAGEVAALQKERMDAVAETAKVLAVRDARVLFLEDQLRVLESECHELRASLGRAQADTAVRDLKLAEFESSLSGTKKAQDEQGDQESKIQALSAEIVGLRCALATEKDVVLQAQLRRATLEKSLDEARSQSRCETSLENVVVEMEKMRQQVEDLNVMLRKRPDVREADRSVEPVRVEAEPIEVEVLPPEQKTTAHVRQQAPEADCRTAERSRRPVDTTSSGQGRSPAGRSLADLEQQARRELERLGAQGANFFKKKR